MKERFRATAICVSEQKMLMVRLEDPLTKTVRFFPPGGRVEENETPAQAAIRETKEETGYEIELYEGTELVRDYPFEWEGTRYDVRTHFFLSELKSKIAAPVNDASYHRGVQWIPLKEVPSVLSFDSNIKRAVIDLISSIISGR